jgi:hypothetical protein
MPGSGVLISDEKCIVLIRIYNFKYLAEEAATFTTLSTFK